MAHSKPVNPRRLSFAVSVVALGIVPGHSAMADQQIGAAAQVVNTVTGTIQSSRQRSVMRAGIDVFQNEAIDTGDNSASRVVFQDRTELSIGPTSEVVLDRFVFDPNPSNSAVAVSVAKGVARFSTGLLPKPDYLIRTPSCTIGVRGTVFTVIVTAARATAVSVESGIVYITAQGATIIVSAGQSTFVPFGQPPSPPVPSPPPPVIEVVMDTLLRTRVGDPNHPDLSPNLGAPGLPTGVPNNQPYAPQNPTPTPVAPQPIVQPTPQPVFVPTPTPVLTPTPTATPTATQTPTPTPTTSSTHSSGPVGVVGPGVKSGR